MAEAVWCCEGKSNRGGGRFLRPVLVLAAHGWKSVMNFTKLRGVHLHWEAVAGKLYQPSVHCLHATVLVLLLVSYAGR